MVLIKKYKSGGVKKVKKVKRDVKDYAKTTLSLGLGTAVGAGMVSASPSAAPMMAGFSSMSGMMPMVSTGVMGGNVLRIVKGYNKPRKRKNKRR